MQSFTWRFTPANETASDSILASVAGPLAYLFVPIIGVLSWQLVAAIVTGFIAKENVVGTLAVCFLGAAESAELGEVLPLSAERSSFPEVSAGRFRFSRADRKNLCRMSADPMR